MIKNKITKQLIKNGTETCSEKILIKSIKKIQKNSKIKSKDLIILTVRNTIPIYKLHKFEQKKRKKKKVTEIPGFILFKLSRIAQATKSIINQAKTDKKSRFYIKLTDEIIKNSKQSETANIFKKKLELQKNVSSKSRLFRYYKLN